MSGAPADAGTGDLRRLTLVLGGARSGKSRFAEGLAERSSRPVLYVATATAMDAEMQRRIAAHRRRRPAAWRTLEVQRNVAAGISTHAQAGEVVLLEDLALLAAACLPAVEDERARQADPQSAQAAMQQEADALCELPGPLVVVSNEVGMGVVPPYPAGRLFRDILGWANQRMAARADRVYVLVAGIPVVIK